MSRQRVLVVDDDIAVRQSLCDELQVLYEVESAASGEEALAMIEPGRYDAIVSDVRMPGVGGVEVLRAASAIDPDCVRVFLTGYADARLYESAKSVGAFKLNKPWGDELEITLRQALLQRGGARPRMSPEPDRAEARNIQRSRLAATAALAATVAQHLRSPLGVLVANHEFVADGVSQLEGVSVELRDALADCQQAMRQIDRLVANLQALAIEPNERPASSLRETIAALREVVEPELSSNGWKLSVDVHDDPVIEADAGDCCQILAQLVQCLSDGQGERGVMQITARRHEGSVKVALRATGTGPRALAAVPNVTPVFGTDRRSVMGVAVARQMLRRLGGDLKWSSAEFTTGSVCELTFKAA